MAYHILPRNVALFWAPMRTGRCRPSEPRLPSAVPDGSKDKSPRLKRDHGGWVLVAVAGIVLFSGSILAVIMRQYSGLLLLPPSFKRLLLDEAFSLIFH